MTEPCFFRVNQVKHLKNIINNVPEDTFLSRYNEDTSVNATTRFVYDKQLNVVLFGFEDYKIKNLYVLLETGGSCWNNVLGVFTSYSNAKIYAYDLAKKFVDENIIYDMTDEEYDNEILSHIKYNYEIVKSPLFRGGILMKNDVLGLDD